MRPGSPDRVRDGRQVGEAHVGVQAHPGGARLFEQRRQRCECRLRRLQRFALDHPRRTVIRALLVPALMRLLGNANWWMPNWARVALRIPHRTPVPEVAAEFV